MWKITFAIGLAFLAIIKVQTVDTLAAKERQEKKLQEIVCWPSVVKLKYADDRQQVIVQAEYDDGSSSDITELANYKVEAPGIATVDSGVIAASARGNTEAVIQWNGLETKLAIEVDTSDITRPLQFRNDILPILTRSGCNSGKCHGAASGKDGFRLSLYGFDPDGDHFRLTRELSGRRINLSQPTDCLLVNKATGDVPHTGGALIEKGSPNYRKLVEWIAGGAAKDAANVPLPVGIEVFPPRAVMPQAGEKQKMVVMANYDDGSCRDVTAKAVFLSNNDGAATISDEAVITGTGPGTAFILARFDQFTSGTSVIIRPGKPYPGIDFDPINYIDELTLAKWKDLHLLPSEGCADEVFLRRIYLDTIGLLPTSKQREEFLAGTAPDKRQTLIKQLIADSQFNDMWIMKFSELLQIRSANGLSRKGLSLYDSWLREKVHAGAKFDEIIRELIVASGSTFDNPATSYYQTETTPQLLAENIAQAFLGTRIQCAQCHNHPFDRWTMDDYYGFASFVSQVGYKQAKDPREITVYNLGEGSLKHPVEGRPIVPKFLGGDVPELESGKDYREYLANWLTSPDNDAFAKNLANIVWSHYFGTGIVDSVDDVRVSNPPSNPALLEALGQKLVDYQFDIGRLSEDICNSRTYQLATQTNDWNDWDERNFSHSRIRRLRAEVLLDCISQVTNTTDTLAGLPLGGRAIQVPDGESNNYFLSTFGRASRNTPCSCEVSTAPTLSQALHLLNGENTTGKIEKGAWIDATLSSGKDPVDVARAIYINCLTRKPTNEEDIAIKAFIEQSSDVRTDLIDLMWAVLNSNEFIFNH